MLRPISILTISLFLTACQSPSTGDNIEQLTEEIADAEKAFSDSTLKKGFMRAYLDFASEDAVLFNDGDSVLSTVVDVQARVAKIPAGGKPPYEMTWTPEKIDASGSLAYTYGRFRIVSRDSTGREFVKTGLYSSVWKRQADGKWKVVMD